MEGAHVLYASPGARAVDQGGTIRIEKNGRVLGGLRSDRIVDVAASGAVLVVLGAFADLGPPPGERHYELGEDAAAMANALRQLGLPRACVRVSAEQVAADPGAYAGGYVELEGLWTRGFEVSSLAGLWVHWTEGSPARGRTTQHRVRVRGVIVAAPPGAPAMMRAHLYVASLEYRTSRIGRLRENPGAETTLLMGASRWVSGDHPAIELRAGDGPDASFWLVDAAATVNGQPVAAGGQRLASGDVMDWRGRRFVFEEITWSAGAAAVHDAIGQNDFDRAEAVARVRVDHARRVLSSAELASALRLHAAVLDMMRRSSDAEPLALEALRLDESSFGPDDPAVARDLQTLGIVTRSLGRSGVAADVLARCIAITERTGEKPQLLQATLAYALAANASGRLEDAARAFERAAVLAVEVEGPAGLRTARALNGLGETYRLQGRPDEAVDAAARATRAASASARTDTAMRRELACAWYLAGAAAQDAQRPAEARLMLRFARHVLGDARDPLCGHVTGRLRVLGGPSVATDEEPVDIFRVVSWSHERGRGEVAHPHAGRWPFDADLCDATDFESGEPVDVALDLARGRVRAVRAIRRARVNVPGFDVAPAGIFEVPKQDDVTMRALGQWLQAAMGRASVRLDLWPSYVSLEGHERAFDQSPSWLAAEERLAALLASRFGVAQAAMLEGLVGDAKEAAAARETLERDGVYQRLHAIRGEVVALSWDEVPAADLTQRFASLPRALGAAADGAFYWYGRGIGLGPYLSARRTAQGVSFSGRLPLAVFSDWAARFHSAFGSLTGPRGAHLRLEGEGDAVHELTLVEGRSYYVGRAADVEVRLMHASVGRRALRIELENGTVFVDDNGAGGGTALNGVDRPSRVALRDGDLLHVGRVPFRVRLRF